MSPAGRRHHDVRIERIERRQLRLSGLAAAALVLLFVFVFFIEEGLRSPSGMTFKGVFASSSGVQPGTPVRIAGVTVGQVTGTSRGPGNAETIAIAVTQAALPLHSDATLAIVPRLILQGSYYVRLEPGTPGAPALLSDGTIPERHTSVPVQLDQVLDTFNQPTRRALQDTFSGLATALGTHGRSRPTGAQALQGLSRALVSALPPISRSARDLQGTEPNDLHDLIVYLRDFTSQFGADPAALSGLTSRFNQLMGTLAAEDQPLAKTVVGLDTTLRAGRPALAAINTALPTVTAFSRALDPVLRASPQPLTKSTELLRQVQAISRPSELPTLLTETGPFFAIAPQLDARLGPFLGLVTPLSRCISQNVAPALDEHVPDGALTTGDPAYLDFDHAIAGAVSVSGGFDGNGAAIRFGIASSPSSLVGVLPGLGAFEGTGLDIQGVRPTWLGYDVEPPWRPDQWCDEQPLPDLSARNGVAPSWYTEAKRAPPLRFGTGVQKR